MKRIDLKRDLKDLYAPSSGEAELVKVPRFTYIMIDGTGDPTNSQRFTNSVQALYTASYTLKFIVKKEKKVDYPVMALEGLWWADNMDAFLTGLRSDWKWTLMILQPTVVTKNLFRKAVKEAFQKKGFASLLDLRLESYQEGLAAQIMHIGTYAEEGPTIQKLHEFARDRGLLLRGKHHEIYLSDPRRVSAAKMKTIVRQPVQRAQRP